MQTKILITGANGQLGQCLCNVLASKYPEVIVVATDIDTLDASNADEVDAILASGGFSHLVNCVAYTAVDRAETDVDRATILNTAVPKILGSAASRHNVRIIHISTDYVFPGTGNTPLAEDAPTGPETVYGTTKLNGEKEILSRAGNNAIIIRTSWLYSASAPSNFIKTMLRLGAGDKPINVVNDQFGSPTNADDLAGAIAAIITSERWIPGIYHYANTGVATWYQLATEALRLAGCKTPVFPISTAQYPTPAKRPAYSALCLDKISQVYPEAQLFPWPKSLEQCIKRIKSLQ